MTLVIDKPPVTGGKPPELPPYLRKRGGPERRTIIIPDIIRIEQQEIINNHEFNWTTIIYHHMNRVIGESMFDPDCRWEYAHSSTRRYRQWLETYHYPSGIPPHIQFGGAIESGKGDPAFYARWEAWAKETFF